MWSLNLDGSRFGVQKLDGVVPAGLGRLSGLQVLHLGANRLTGPIPAELGDLRSLATLNLHGNLLTGSIPAELTQLPATTSIDLSGNRLTGCIPALPAGSTVNPQTDSRGRDYNLPQCSVAADLSALAIAAGATAVTLNRTFSGAITGYTAAVGADVASLTVTPTAARAGATIRVNGSAVTSGMASGAVSLGYGANTVSVAVTASDTVTTKTYTVAVTRARSADADLSALELSEGTLVPAFKAADTSYTVNVGRDVTSLTLSPATSHPLAAAAVTAGTPVTGNRVSLGLGRTVVTVTVTAHDGTTTKAYTVTVTRQRSGDSSLSALSLSAGGSGVALNETFAPGTTSYTADVANTVTRATLAATAAHGGASLEFSPDDVDSGTDGHQFDLGVGPTAATVTVTAEDRTTRDYVVTVTRPNTAPAAEAGEDDTVNQGALVTLDGSGSADPEGLALTWLWSQTGGRTVALSDAAAAQPTFTAPTGLTRDEALAFSLVVTDFHGASSTDTVTITVSADSVPEFGSAAFSPPIQPTGEAVDLLLPAASGGNAPLTYTLGAAPALPVGLVFDGATRRITGTPTVAKAPATYTLTATDADADTDTLRFTLGVSVHEATVSLPSAPLAEGGGVTATLGASPPAAGTRFVVHWAVEAVGEGGAAADFRDGAVAASALPSGSAAAPGGAGTGVRIATYDDNAAERAERFRVRITDACIVTGVTVTACGPGDARIALGAPAGFTIRASDRSPGLTAWPAGVTVAEAGGQGAFTVELHTRPASAVTVTVASADTLAAVADTDGGATGRQDTLTFAASDWETPQTVTVAGVNDDADNAANRRTAAVTVRTGSADPLYAGLRGTVSVTVADDDTGMSTGLTVTPGVTRLAAAWTAPPGGADGYKVQWKSGAQEYAVARQAVVAPAAPGDAPATSHTITGLTAGVRYTVRVIATVAGQDDGAPSLAAAGTPGGVPAGQATTVTVTPGAGALDVAWIPVAAASGYKVQWRSGTESWGAAARQATVTAGHAHTIPHLVVGRRYAVRVIAVGAVGVDGPPSAEAAGTPKLPPAATPAGVAAAAAVDSLAVSWDRAANASGYKVQWRSGTQGYAAARQALVAPAVPGGAPATSHTIADLDAGTRYAVRVIATRTGGVDSPPSAEAFGVPKLAPVTVSLSVTGLLRGSGGTFREGDRDTAWPGLQLNGSFADRMRVHVTATDPLSSSPTHRAQGAVACRVDFRTARILFLDVQGAPHCRGLSLPGTTRIESSVKAVTGTVVNVDVAATYTLSLDSATIATAGGGTRDVVLGTSSVTVHALGGNTAPSFAAAPAGRTFLRGAAIAGFQVPAASGGNGPLAYTASGLPPGLVFDADGGGDCPGAEPRRICGTPSVLGSSTVTITARDADSDASAGDRATTSFPVTVAANPVVAAPSPSPLTEAGLDGATLAVTLAGTTFAGAGAGRFELVTGTPAISGLSISGVAGAAGADTATLTLAFDGDFDTPRTLAVKVKAAGHSGGGDVVSNALAVAPAPGVTVGAATLALAEAPGHPDHAKTYTMVLDSAPPGATTVTVGGGGASVTVDTDGDTPGDQDTLVFTGSDWKTARTVTVRAAQDDDSADESVTLGHAVTAGAAPYAPALAIDGVAVTVTDDDTPALSLSTASLSLTEEHAVAGTGRYGVALATLPGAAVTVTVSSGDAAVAVDTDGNSNGDQSTLVFDGTSWSTAQTVTVRAESDIDTEGETVTVTHTAAGGGYADAGGTVTVNVTDNDGPGVSVRAPGLTGDGIAEGASETYGVALANRPGGAVTVTVTGGGAVVAVDTDSNSPGDQSTLVFTGTSWSTAQTVTVRAAADDDGADAAVTLTHDPSGTDYEAAPSATVSFTVRDGDERGVTLGASALSVNEEASAAYTVVLDTAPVGTVTVTVGGAGGGVSVDADGDEAGDQGALSFTSADWDTAQTVTVRAAADDDDADERAVLTHAVAGGDYGPAGVAAGAVTVTVDDDDAPGLTVSPGRLAVDENGSGGYSLRLATEPGSDVAVRVRSDHPDVEVDADDRASGDQDRVTFTRESWNVARRVAVRAADDDGAGDETALLTHTVTSTDRDYASLAAAARPSVSVSVADDDPPALVFSRRSLSLTEEAPGAAWTVALATKPVGPVSVRISSGDGAKVAADTDRFTPGVQGRLAFTPDDWSTGQTVTVRALADDDVADETVTVTHAASGGGYGGVTGVVTVNVADDDTPAVAVSAPGLTGGGLAETASGTYEVALAWRPGGAVTVSVSSDDASVTVDTDPVSDGRQDTLVFTPDDWSTARTVTVTAAADADGADERVTLTHDPAGADYAAAADAVLTFTVDDRDLRGVTFNPSYLGNVPEAGEPGVYTVALDTEPVGTVVVTIGVKPTATIQFTDTVRVDTDPATAGDQNTLTFKASDYGAKRVRVRFDENEDFADAGGELIHTVTGGDYGAAGVTAGEVTVTERDKDSANVAVSPSSLTVREGGGAGRYTLRLTAKPFAAVVLSVRSSNPEVTVDTDDATPGDQSEVTFTPADWSLPQAVAVRAGSDDDDADDTASLSHSTVLGRNLDSWYSVASQRGRFPSVAVTVTDDDTPALSLSTASLSLTEEHTVAGTGRYGVALATKPGAAVTVTVTSGDVAVAVDTDRDLNGDQRTLVFNASNWSTVRTVTVRAEADADTEGETVTVTHTAAGGGYGDASGTVTVRVTDDDAPGVSVRAPGLTGDGVAEGASETYEAALTSRPSGAVTVTITGGGTALAVDTDSNSPGDQNTLVFTGTSWSTAQTVTVRAATDADGADAAVTLTHDPSGADYGAAPSALVSFTVRDGNERGVTLGASVLSVNENASATYTVVLDTAPVGTVTVTVGGAGGGVAVDADGNEAGDQGALSFTSANWDTAQTVTVRAAEDDDDADGRAVLTHAVTGGDYGPAGIAAGEVAVTVVDDDGPAVSISSPTVAEGAASDPWAVMSFAVTLDAASARVVTVDYAEGTGGTASEGTFRAGVDYRWPGDGTLAFAPGETAKSIPPRRVAVFGDDKDEPDETVVVALSGPVNATLGTATGTGTITDDDDPPAVSISSPTVAEGAAGAAATLSFAVGLDAASGKQVTVDYAEGTGGTAAAGTDYTALTAGTLTLAAGETSRTLDVAVAGDADDEGNETVVVALSAPVNATLGTAEGTGTIVDDDGGPALSISSPRVAEGDSGDATLRFTVRLSPANERQVTVAWADAGTGTAASGTDYAALAGGTLTFAAGETVKTVDATVRGDGTDEPDETVVVALSGPSDATLGTGSGTGTIADDDPAPAVSISSPRVAEGDRGEATLAFAVTLDAASGKQVTVAWADAGTGTAASGTDYTALAGGTLIFAPGETVKTVDAAVRGDPVDEADETVAVALSAPVNARLGTASGAGTILDDDASTISISSTEVAEGDSGDATLRFAVTLSTPSAGPVEVAWADAGTGAATSGTDYAALAGGTLTFAAGETVKTLDVTVKGDTDDEPNETVVLTLSGAVGAVLGTSSGTGTIRDDDGPAIAISSPVVEEGDAGGVILRFTVTLSEASVQQVTVRYRDAETGTAAPGTDYAALAAGTLAIAAGATSGTIPVTVLGDALDEPDETVVVALSAPVNATLGATRATGTITDDDDPPAISISSPSVVEGNGGDTTLTFAVTLDAASGRRVTVDHADAGTGTAASGTDYTAHAAGALTFAEGVTAKYLDVAVRGDTDDERNETVAIALSAPVNATLAAAGGVGVIWDDDGLPSLSMDSPSVAEGASGTTAALRFTVRLVPASTSTVTVRWGDTFGGTATRNTDYTAPGGMLTFAPGETARTYDVTVRGDAADEPDETVQMDLSSAVNADFGGGARTTLGTIRDDDPAPDAALSLSPSSVSENGGVATVSATLSHPSSQPSTVTVTAGSGAAGLYTVGADATIVIAAGATTNAADTATVIAVDNRTDEPNRTPTVTATLANGQGAGTVSGATLTLSDDETPPQPTIGAQGAISENGGKTTVTVSLTHPSSAATTVTVSLVDSGLLAAPADAAIVIAAGATTSADTIVFTAVDNDVDAASEVTTRIVLSAVNALGVSTSNPAIWIVLDDDDTAGIAVDPATSSSSRLRTTESGGTAAFTVKLDSEPTGNVALDVASADTTEGTAAPSTLTFTPSDWSDAQTVTLTGVADSLVGDDASYTVTLTVDRTDTADAKYDALSAVTVYAVNVDHLHGLDVGAVSGQATEAGGTATFTVALLTQPSAAVTVAVTSRDPGEGSVSPSALTFAPSAWNTALTVTVTGVQDPVDDGAAAWSVRLDPSSGDASYGGLADEDVAVTTTDDDDPPTVTMALDPASVSESGGVATVTARLSHPSGAATTVTVAASAGADTEAGDFTLSSPANLTVAAGATTSSGTVTVAANADTVDEPDGSVAVTATIDNARAAADGTTMAVTDATLAIADDDDPPALSISSPRVSEGAAGAVLSFAVGLDAASGKQVTVRYADAGDGTAASNEDYTALAAGTLTFAAGETAKTVEVTVRGDTADEPDETVRVTLSDPVDATVAEGAQTAAGTIEDDDDAPSATLALSPASIGEDGGVATVTATLSHPSSAESTIAVSAAPAPSTGAEAGDFTLSSPAALTVAAGETASAGTVTITAVDDPADAPDKSVTVSGRLSNGQGAGTVAAATLTLADDDPLPVASLVLTPASISEDGGVATVTASLSRPSSAAVTITVSASPGAGTDFTLSAAATLTVAAGETASAGTVTITARDAAGHGPDRQVAVAGAATGGRGVADPSDAALAIVDDDAPAVTLSLSSSTIAENGGVATVTATLDQASSVATTVTVAAAAGAGAVSGDFSQDGATLTIAATATTTTDVVTITALNDATDSPDKRVDVSGTAANRLGAASPGGLTLTIEDDDDAPAVVLSLAPSAVEEAAGGAVTVTAQLSHPSSAASTVTVTAGDSGLYTVGADATIVIPAGATASVSDTAVIVVANADDAVHQGSAGRTVTVTAALANGQGAGAVTGAALTLTDDEAIPFPTVTYSPSGAIAENGGKTTVTVTLSHPSGAATTVTADVETGRLSTPADAKIVIAAGATTSADTIVITAVDNDVDAADYDAAFTLNIRNPLGLRSDALQDSGATLVRKGRAVTLTDDDTAGVSVSPATSTTSRLRTTESGGTATFTVRLDSEPTGDVALDVASSDTGEGTAAPAVLTFTSSTWSTAQTVTLTGVDDSPPAADGSQGYTVTLTVDTANTADASYDALSAVTVYAVNSDNEFGLDVGSVTGQATEAGGTATFTVALLTQPSAAVTVSVTSRDEGEGLVSAGGGAPAASTTLTFAPAAWSTAQTVMVTGVQDPVDDGTVAWNVRLDPSSGDSSYDGLLDEDVSVSTTDDDGPPTVTLALNPASVAESGTGNVATVTARLSHPSGAATTVTVAPVSGAYMVGADATIVIAAGATTNASDTATVAAVDNTTDEPDRTPTVTGTVTNDRAAADSTTMTVTGATLTITDDDPAPTAALALAPSSVSENGGIATVTATLSHPSSEPSTVTVAAASGLYTVGTDATITIAAGSTTAASDTVLVTAVDDAVHQGSAGRTATVSAALANGQGAGAVTGAALTLTDDEALPTVALALSSTSISETGGVATVTAELSGPSSAAVTVTVAAAAGSGAVVDDFTLSTATTLTFAAGRTTSAGLVTVTANGNTVDSPNKSVTVSGTSAGGNGVVNPPNVTLTLTDDETLPTVALVLTPTSITETNGVSTVTATLSGPSSEAVTVTVAAAAGAGAVAADFALSSATTLTFAAGSTTSAGLVTVTANGNTVDSPNKSVTVSGTAAGGQRGGGPDGRDPDPGGRRHLADGGAGALRHVDFGDGRRSDGDGGTLRSVERGGDGDGGRGGGDGRGRGRLHPEHGDDPDHRGGGDDERGHGDGDRERQHGGCAEQVGDGVGRGGGGQRRRGPAGRDPDPGGRRCLADGGAGPHAFVDYGGRRPLDGDRDALRPVERGGDGDGGRGGGGRGGRGRLRPEHGDDADDRGGRDGERGHGDGDRERQRRGLAEQVGDGVGRVGGGQRRRGPAERDPDPDR